MKTLDRSISAPRALVAGALGAAVMLLATVPGAGAANVSYGFDTGDQGWLVSQGNGTFGAPNFNPGGYISAQDTVAESGCPSAPCAHLFFASPTIGSLATNYGGSLSFDFASSTAPFYLGLAYIDSANNDAPELRRSFPPAASGFGKVTLPLTEAGWEYCTENPTFACTPATQAQFQSVLSYAIYVDVLADVNDGTGQTYSLDNVAVSEAPVPAKKKKCKKKGNKKGRNATAAKKKKKKCKKKKGKKRSSAASAGAPHVAVSAPGR